MQKGFASFIVIILILVAGIGIAGYTILIQKTTNKELEQLTPSISPSQTNTPSISPENLTTSTPIPQPTHKMLDLYTAPRFVEPGYIKPVEVTVSDICYDKNGIFICKSLGEVNLTPSVKVKIEPVYTATKKTLDTIDEVMIEFYENGQKLSIPPYKSYWQADANWFLLEVSYLDRDNIYIDDGSGHETGFTSYYYDGTKWNELDPWEWIENDFPDIHHPVFSLVVSSKYLKVVEENYCCDTIYSSDDPNRVMYRQVYTLDRITKKIIKKEQTPR